ncbi:MAG: hypothetical protein M3Q87_05850, partial [Actinomycetota bacterium]|nr:hypothetical protein [Actinomycetota bacterium]
MSGAASPARVLEAAATAVGIDVGSALRAVRESGVLVSSRAGSTDVYAYRHPVLQEVLYAELPATERAQLHAVMAEHLEVEYR